MSGFRRTWLCWLLLALPARDQTNAEDFADPKPSWGESMTLRGGVGYEDNVSLSAVSKEGSAFFAAGLDALALRSPASGPDISLVLTGDDHFLLRNVGLRDEQLWLASGQIRDEIRPGLELGFSLQSIYQSEIFDASETETNLLAIPLRGESLAAEPSLAWRFDQKDHLRLSFPVTRQFLAQPLDDYWEGGPILSLDHAYGFRSLLSLTYAFSARAYDHREQTDRYGVSAPGSSLGFNLHTLDLADRHSWDEKRFWTSQSQAGWDWNSDNGSGYFSYQQGHVSEQLRYAGPLFGLAAGVRLNYYHYAVQTGDPPDLSARYFFSTRVTLRAEAPIGHGLKGFAELAQESNLSNRALSDYRSRTFLAGMEWDVESGVK